MPDLGAPASYLTLEHGTDVYSCDGEKIGKVDRIAAAGDADIFDGIVIKGDLSQNLGAPVQRGEVLMVLAPNDSFRLILEVDEADIAAVRPGQVISITARRTDGTRIIANFRARS